MGKSEREKSSEPERAGDRDELLAEAFALRGLRIAMRSGETATRIAAAGAALGLMVPGASAELERTRDGIRVRVLTGAGDRGEWIWLLKNAV